MTPPAPAEPLELVLVDVALELGEPLDAAFDVDVAPPADVAEPVAVLPPPLEDELDADVASPSLE